MSDHRIVITGASEEIRQRIYRARHRVYALEIGQHSPNPEARLTDALDASNRYLVAMDGDELAGFVSITPPGEAGYSIDKYFGRDELPFVVDEGLFEIRLLTVMPGHRSSELAAALMMAAFRWIEARGGSRVVAIGRREVKTMYLKAGMSDTGRSVKAGAVTYDLLHAGIATLRGTVDRKRKLLDRIEAAVDWQLQVPLRKPASCFHGGAFFGAIGADFASLGRHRSIINADVLDAWFPPAPAVMEALREHLPWLMRTSPPTACEGLVAAIAAACGVPESCILPGAGSSDLIFRALPRWLTPRSRAVLLDPTYGEYAHVLEKVIGCRVERFPLERADGYEVNIGKLVEWISSGPDLVVLVNPNSPTGRGLTAAEIEVILAAAPSRTRVWIDETYIDYTGESVERLVARHENLIVCKSMSKAYALSGMRVAYLCAGQHHLEELRALTPPWVVGLPSQVAAVKALESTSYYVRRWKQTASLRDSMARDLRKLGWEVIPGSANFLLAHVPEDVPAAREIVAACRERELFLRDAAAMGSHLGERAVRLAVKDAVTNRKMIEILSDIAGSTDRPGRASMTTCAS
ncbi:histidinol-phosphate aminotransferase family protein [Luteolibacter arcticus]|uniref:Aminotransferase n=1 Tax=Luteolibacter arcticus TaxID=1581411 RepID=A0ABT3GS76_9BACT|nr:histidinol-phosphate transaminase [Luteolibacter arcticus]MCW1926357.1 histidinol-phosphate aminotransferase family protein [Luteolibacter arcticus]